MKCLVTMILISLALFSCSISHKIIPLSGQRYEIQVKYGLMLEDRKAERYMREKASEVCKGKDYKFISTDSTTTFTRGETTKRWILECIEK